jgi:hypothetical protein
MSTHPFPTDTAGLPEAHAPELVELSDGDRIELRIAPVAKRFGDTTVRMLAYNGSIPGPTLKVKPQTSAAGWRTATSPSTTKAAWCSASR